jgi:hypothetical protein
MKPLKRRATMAKERKPRNASSEQALELMSKLAGGGRITSLPADHIQWMIENMREVGPYFAHFMESGGLRDIRLITKVRNGCETKRWLDRSYTKAEQLEWIEESKSKLDVDDSIDLVALVKAGRLNSRIQFPMMLMSPGMAPEDVDMEFAIRRCDPAEPIEVIRLLDGWRGSKKVDFPFVSLSGKPVVAHLEGFKDDGKIIVRPYESTNLPERAWSYIGAQRD